MNERIIAVAALLVVACVGGCSAVRPFRSAHDERHEADEHDGEGHGEALAHHEIPTDPTIVAAAAKVRVLNDEKLDCPSQVLGIVDVHEPVESDEAALEILRRRAAALGAEAITGVEFRHGDARERTHMSGTAVRCKDLLEGRRYDVLDHVVIRAKMGGEDEAFDELKRRSRALGGNLILDAKFQHGESAADGVVVSGTVVRAYEAAGGPSAR